MMQQRTKQEVFAKLGAPPRPEELLPSPHVKNTPAGGLSGQHFRLAPKSVHNPKATPGVRLSAAPHRDEAAARLTTQAFPSLECASQMPLRSPVPDSENLPPRRPLKLAPLELPEVVRESQREKIRGLPAQEATKAVSRKLDTGGNEPCPRKVKACARKGPVKAPACPSLMASPAPVKGLPPPQQQQQGAAPRAARLARARPVELSGDRLEAVVCRGTPAPSRPAPPSLFPSVNANARTSAARGGQGTCRNASALHQREQQHPQQETGRRRLRLRRAERLEEDQGKSNTSTGGLSADESKVAQGLPQRRGQQRTELVGTLRLLEKASKRNPVAQQPGNTTMEVLGRALRRIAVSNLQDASPLAL